jgi:hypothetical protein
MSPHQVPEIIPEENEVTAPEPEQSPEEEWLADPAFQPFRLRLEPVEPFHFEEWESEEELDIVTS